MKVGRLNSDLPEAKRALEIANSVSYWTSVRKRVMDRIFLRVSNPHGEDALVTVPEILCHGTVTRRTVESLMVTMCSTKNWRIGTELKSRVQAPDGWKIVGADFDGDLVDDFASTEPLSVRKLANFGAQLADCLANFLLNVEMPWC
jgi:DNA polymerase gamma 1